MSNLLVLSLPQNLGKVPGDIKRYCVSLHYVLPLGCCCFKSWCSWCCLFAKRLLYNTSDLLHP